MTKNSTKKIPRLRFKGFEGEWEEKKLGDVAEFFKGKGYSKKDLLNNGTPIILYGSMYVNYKTSINDYPNTFVKGNESKDVLSKKGDVIVPASGETSTDIARASNIKLDGIILGGDLNIVRPNKILDSLFLAIDISTGDRHIGLSKLAQGNSIVHLHNSDLKSLLLFIPSISEQQKIGSFFAKLDQLIDLQSKKVEQLKKLKRGYFQKLFPQKGESVPRLRFEGFSGEWEEKKIKDLAPLRGGKSFESSKFINDGVPLVRITNILDNLTVGGNFKHYKYNYNLNKYSLYNDSILIAMSGATVGKIAILKSTKEFYQNQRVGYFNIINNKCYTHFLFGLLQSDLFSYNMNRIKVSGAQPNISSKDVDKFIFYVPNNYNEQIKIGDFLENYDYMIQFESRKLDIIVSLKKSYLQKVFC